MQLDLNLTQARSRADIGIERAADKAQRADPDWIDAALALVRYFANTHKGTLFTVENARNYAERMMKRPAGVDGRVWGAITRAAVKAGYVERVRGAYAPAVSSNGSEKPLYRTGPNA